MRMFHLHRYHKIDPKKTSYTSRKEQSFGPKTAGRMTPCFVKKRTKK